MRESRRNGEKDWIKGRKRSGKEGVGYCECRSDGGFFACVGGFWKLGF